MSSSETYRGGYSKDRGVQKKRFALGREEKKMTRARQRGFTTPRGCTDASFNCGSVCRGFDRAASAVILSGEVRLKDEKRGEAWGERGEGKPVQNPRGLETHSLSRGIDGGRGPVSRTLPSDRHVLIAPFSFKCAVLSCSCAASGSAHMASYQKDTQL